MIPSYAITEWSNVVPWVNPHHVEQDLLICRALIAIYSDEYLASRLAFRGGTALHKLFLSPQQRYSEDIDLVQVLSEPIGPVLDRLREVLSFLGVPKVKQKMSNNVLFYQYNAETLPQAGMRLKIEINCKEHLCVLGWAEVPFEVKNSWFSGSCRLRTYCLEELTGTKIRALYQRNKGRDLFDLFKILDMGKVDAPKAIECYRRYFAFSGQTVPSASAYLENLSAKMKNYAFRNDVIMIVRTETIYDIDQAFEAVKSKIIEAMSMVRALT
jgi:predicted nucleotidyltransferase component of viral defense system